MWWAYAALCARLSGPTFRRGTHTHTHTRLHTHAQVQIRGYTHARGANDLFACVLFCYVIIVYCVLVCCCIYWCDASKEKAQGAATAGFYFHWHRRRPLPLFRSGRAILRAWRLPTRALCGDPFCLRENSCRIESPLCPGPLKTSAPREGLRRNSRLARDFRMLSAEGSPHSSPEIDP